MIIYLRNSILFICFPVTGLAVVWRVDAWCGFWPLPCTFTFSAALRQHIEDVSAEGASVAPNTCNFPPSTGTLMYRACMCLMGFPFAILPPMRLQWGRGWRWRHKDRTSGQSPTSSYMIANFMMGTSLNRTNVLIIRNSFLKIIPFSIWFSGAAL